jgi:energy-coupling factor transporter ATP-binding protein EcfA2
MIRRVTDISLIEVMKKYLNRSSADFEKDGRSNRYKTVCPFHKDSDPSLILYDKSDKGQGWDYHCYPCGAHGTAPNMLVSLGIAEKEDEAISLLMKDFGLTLPDKVTLDDFSAFKGLDKNFLIYMGWEDVRDGVSIPFSDTDDTVPTTKIRTKYQGKDKYYYKSYKNIPYGLGELKKFDKNLPIYIAEGETDNVTMLQADFQSIGIPSANDFQKEFVEYIKDFSKIIVVKDNDKAGNKLLSDICSYLEDKTYVLLLPNGVKDINNFHLFRCGGDIATFKERITTLKILPASPRAFISACKADINVAKDLEAWKIISHTLKSPIDKALFIDSMSKATKIGKKAIEELLDEASFESTIRGKRLNREFFQDDNCYFRTVMMGGAPIEKQISNFIIKPLYNKLTEDGEIRVVTLTNTFGKSATVEFTPKELSSFTDFITKVISVGRNNFYGSNEDLTIIRDIIFNEEINNVYSPLAIGHLDTRHWVFENCGINDKGEVVQLKDNGIIELDERAYMPRSISNSEDDSSDTYMPNFDLATVPLNDEELRELLFDFKNNINSYNAWIGLGWCMANWYSDAVFKQYRQFPFLFIVGKRGQGKTTFANLLNRLFGYIHNSNGKSFDNSTPASMSRALNYSCSLPIWYDDYKDDTFNREKTTKTNMLLGAYNRQGGDRASKSATGLDTRAVRATLLISGEYSPSNSALKSRCITTIINGNNRDNTLYNKVSRNFTRLARNSFNTACKAQTDGNKFLEVVESYVGILEEAGLFERTAQNLAVILAGFKHVFGHVLSEEELDAFVRFAIASAKDEENVMEESHHIMQFFNDICNMLKTTGSDFDYPSSIELDDGKLYIKRIGTYDLWQRYKPDHKLPVNEVTLKTDLENEAYYCGDNESRHYFNGSRCRSYVFDFEKMRNLPLLQDFCDAVLEKKNIEY